MGTYDQRQALLDSATSYQDEEDSSSASSGSSRHTPGTDVHVRAYTRKDGTSVREHTRARPGHADNN